RVAAAELQTEFARLAAEASTPPALTLKYEQTKVRGGQGEGAVVGHLHSAGFLFDQPYVNSLNGAELTVEVYEGPTPLLRRNLIRDEPKRLHSETYEFDLDPDGSTGWRKGKNDPLLSSSEVAEKAISRLLEAIGRKARERRR